MNEHQDLVCRTVRRKFAAYAGEWEDVLSPWMQAKLWEFAAQDPARAFPRVPGTTFYQSPIAGVRVSTVLRFAVERAELIRDSGLPGTNGFTWESNFLQVLGEILEVSEDVRAEAEAAAVLRELAG